MLTVDDSVHSSYALSWTLKHLLKPKDTLHCVTVALPVPYPVSTGDSYGSSLIIRPQLLEFNKFSLV